MFAFNQPGQPALLHDGVHEDVARVEEGGAELCQEQTKEEIEFKRHNRLSKVEFWQ